MHQNPHHLLTMSKTVTGKENLYLELQSNVEESTTPAAERNERHSKASKDLEHASNQPAAKTDRCLLCIMTAVVVVSFLTAAATLALALMMVMSRHSPDSCVRGKVDPAFIFSTMFLS